MFSRENTNFVKIGSVTAIVYFRKEINFYPIFHISCLIWMKFLCRRSYLMLLSIYECFYNRFCANQI